MDSSKKQGQVALTTANKAETEEPDRRRQDTAQRSSKTLVQCLVNVTEQMAKLGTRFGGLNDEKMEEADMKVLCKVYQTLNRVMNTEGVLKAEEVGSRHIEVLKPLLQVTSRMIELENLENVKTLVSMLGPLIWQHFKRPLLFPSLVDAIETRDSVLTAYVSSCKSASLTGQIPSVFSYWRRRDYFLANEVMCRKIDGDCYEVTLGLLQFLFNNLKTIRDPIMILSGLNRSDENSMEQDDEEDLHKVMHAIMRNCKNADFTLLNVLLIISQKNLMEEISAVEMSAKADTAKHLFSRRIFSLLVDLSIEKDLGEWLLLVNKNLKRARNQNLVKFIPFNEGSQARKSAIGFVLEMMDHGLNIDYISSKCISKYTLLSMRTINKMANDKIKIYAEFNEMKCKSSLLSVFIYLNFLITNSVLNKLEAVELPPTIIRTFDHFKLPPIPKSNYLLDQRNFSDLDSDITNYLSNMEDMFQSLTILSNLINLFLVDEMNAYQFMNTYSSTEIYEKLVFKNVDLVIVSLFSTFLLLELCDRDDFELRVIEDAITEAFHKLLNLNLKYLNNSFIWVSLIDFANDTCYSSVDLVPHFEKLLNILIHKNRHVLDDSLVKTGLEFFLTSFSNESLQIQPFSQLLDTTATHDSSTVVDLPLEDYKHLYFKDTPLSSMNSFSMTELHPTSTAMSYEDHDITNDNPTASRQVFMTKSARQQSVHVDSFGKI